MFGDDLFISIKLVFTGLICFILGLIVMGSIQFKEKIDNYENTIIEYETCNEDGECFIVQQKFYDYYYHKEK